MKIALTAAMKSRVHSLLLLALAFSSTACDPKYDSVDERQRQITTANASLARMDAINSELTVVGVSVDKAPGVSKPVWSQPENELLIVKQKLEEFISHGATVMGISNRTDVMWAGVPKLEKRMVSARALLAEIDNQLKNVSGELGSKFWDKWNGCRKSMDTGFILHGVRVWQSYSAFDDKSIDGMESETRRKLGQRVRNHIDCSRVVRHGNAVLYGNGEKTNTIHGQPPARFGDIKEKNRDLETLVQKLEAEIPKQN